MNDMVREVVVRAFCELRPQTVSSGGRVERNPHLHEKPRRPEGCLG
jgi:hypothetical protein